jgi:hypothetical protein
MLSATIFLSLIVALAHVVVLVGFAQAPKEAGELGFQHVWRNNTPERGDVAMVWVRA